MSRNRAPLALIKRIVPPTAIQAALGMGITYAFPTEGIAESVRTNCFAETLNIR